MESTESENESVVENKEQDKIPKSTVVTFYEDEEVVEMNVVDTGEFPSPSERDNDESEANQDLTDKEEGEEEEGEISFHNNASSERLTGNDKTIEQLELGQEERIVDKTFAKLQQLMISGGYLKENLPLENAGKILPIKLKNGLQAKSKIVILNSLSSDSIKMQWSLKDRTKDWKNPCKLVYHLMKNLLTQVKS